MNPSHQKNFTPELNVMDNEASKAVKNYIISKNEAYQLVDPHKKRVNAAERATRTFKDHFTAGLSLVHNKFLLFLWDEVLPQDTPTLNVL